MTILESTPKITGSMLNGIFRGRFIAEIRASQSENRPKNPKKWPKIRKSLIPPPEEKKFLKNRYVLVCGGECCPKTQKKIFPTKGGGISDFRIFGHFFGFLGRFSDCEARISAMKRPLKIPLSIEPVIFGVDSKMVISAKNVFPTFFPLGHKRGRQRSRFFGWGPGGDPGGKNDFSRG